MLTYNEEMLCKIKKMLALFSHKLYYCIIWVKVLGKRIIPAITLSSKLLDVNVLRSAHLHNVFFFSTYVAKKKGTILKEIGNNNSE